MNLTLRICAVVVCFASMGSFSSAALVFSEPAGDGPFSADNLNPTNLGAFPNGITSVRGVVQGAQTTGNIDVFTLLVPNGFELAAIRATDYISTDSVAFVGIDSGPTFRYDSFGLDEVNFFNPAFPFDFLGGSTFGPSTVTNNTDLLATMGNIGLSFGQGGGFTGPLGPGQYTLFVQQKGGALTEYEFAFELVSTAAAVPEPSSLAFMLGSCAIVGLRRRRK